MFCLAHYCVTLPRDWGPVQPWLHLLQPNILNSLLLSHNRPINKPQPETVSELCRWPLCVKQNRRKLLEGAAGEGTGDKANALGVIH